MSGSHKHIQTCAPSFSLSLPLSHSLSLSQSLSLSPVLSECLLLLLSVSLYSSLFPPPSLLYAAVSHSHSSSQTFAHAVQPPASRGQACISLSVHTYSFTLSLSLSLLSCPTLSKSNRIPSFFPAPSVTRRLHCVCSHQSPGTRWCCCYHANCCGQRVEVRGKGRGD